jgi:hypothetical protein
MRFTLKTLLALLLVAGVAAADIGPKPTTSGRTPLPPGEDMEGVEVEMAAERVDLILSKTEDPRRERLDVTAVFEMKNHGETVTFETGFPVGAYPNMSEFSITIDGRKVDFDLVNRGTDEEDRPATRGGRGRARADYWYVWQATYPGRATSRHVVKYAVDVFRPMMSQRTGYVLSTGAPWKNAIGSAVVTLRCADGMTLDHLLELEPFEGGVRHEDRIVWTFEDLEPTKEHDIRISYCEETRTDAMARAREKAKSSWLGREWVAIQLSRRPALHFREEMTDEELPLFLDALADLVPEVRREGDRISLESEEARPHYTDSPKELFRWMNDLAEIVRRHPGNERARELLAVWVELVEHSLDGRLEARGKRLERRGKHRDELAGRLAEARSVLEGAD